MSRRPSCLMLSRHHALCTLTSALICAVLHTSLGCPPAGCTREYASCSLHETTLCVSRESFVHHCLSLKAVLSDLLVCRTLPRCGPLRPSPPPAFHCCSAGTLGVRQCMHTVTSFLDLRVTPGTHLTPLSSTFSLCGSIFTACGTSAPTSLSRRSVTLGCSDTLHHIQQHFIPVGLLLVMFFCHGSLGPNPWLFFFLHVHLARVSLSRDVVVTLLC